MQENGKYVCAPVVEKALLESDYIFQGAYKITYPFPPFS